MIANRKRCIFLIGGSHFTKFIPNHSSWIHKLKEFDYVIKNSPVADINILIKDCQKFIESCLLKYPNPTIGVLGISSGGYYALRLKKMIPRLKFCIGIAPVINPQLRKQLLQQLPASIITPKLKQVIRATPSFRKIYNKLDSETLIIVGKKDIQVPLEMFDEYQIPNLVVLKSQDHKITQEVFPEIMDQINKFLKECDSKK